ncbi:hypothetical protein SDC9_97310 [bioreactor metagenome]|uniref:DUF4358 domain-containing protein n=1 Tax=bioreactor metagenome TaxID=1076179 RepID=A0A645ACZ1_9ZZZZ|nr:DUF4358 domain-containing protein [Oscillospiraceae bacterium]
MIIKQAKASKICTSLLITSILMCFLFSCAPDNTAAVSLYDLQKTMLAADSLLPEMSSVNGSAEDASEMFTYLSNMPYNKVENYFLAYSSEGKADEIAVITVKNSADIEEAKKSLDEHVKNRIKLYEQYDPTQLERVNKALIFTSGKFAVLIISDNAAAVRNSFKEFISKAI